MTREVNAEEVNDRAKLIMHRMIARSLARNPELIEQAKSLIEQYRREGRNYSFYKELEELLNRGPQEIRRLIVQRTDDMYRLRNSSPLGLPTFRDIEFRRRIWRKARQGMPCQREASQSFTSRNQAGRP